MSRLGCTIAGIRALSENRMTKRLEVKEGGEELLLLPPESTESLNADAGGGVTEDVFVFGLHNPFDSTERRLLVG